MIDFLIIGIILGLSAGFAPGPLLTLVISETLHHGAAAGVKVALAPFITDLPIIIITLYVFTWLSDFQIAAGIISLVGGGVILSMGYKSLRLSSAGIVIDAGKPRSLTKGILANALSPHPYLFWFGVGGPTATKAYSLNILAAAAFIAGFYICLIGSKLFIALVVGRSRSFLKGKAYLYTSRFLGLMLCLLAFVLFRDGLRLIGLL